MSSRGRRAPIGRQHGEPPQTAGAARATADTEHHAQGDRSCTFGSVVERNSRRLQPGRRESSGWVQTSLLRDRRRGPCAGGGHANHAEIANVPISLCAKVPDGVSLDRRFAEHSLLDRPARDQARRPKHRRPHRCRRLPARRAAHRPAVASGGTHVVVLGIDRARVEWSRLAFFQSAARFLCEAALFRIAKEGLCSWYGKGGLST
jgi:hypothetical protein